MGCSAVDALAKRLVAMKDRKDKAAGYGLVTASAPYLGIFAVTICGSEVCALHVSPIF